MNARKRGLGDIAWDLFIFGWCAFITALSLTGGNWKTALRYVILGVMVLALHGAMDEWRDAMTDRIEKRREQRAGR